MKRAFWIGLIAVALLMLAVAGMVARSVHRPSTHRRLRAVSAR